MIKAIASLAALVSANALQTRYAGGANLDLIEFFKTHGTKEDPKDHSRLLHELTFNEFENPNKGAGCVFTEVQFYDYRIYREPAEAAEAQNRQDVASEVKKKSASKKKSKEVKRATPKDGAKSARTVKPFGTLDFKPEAVAQQKGEGEGQKPPFEDNDDFYDHYFRQITLADYFGFANHQCQKVYDSNFHIMTRVHYDQYYGRYFWRLLIFIDYWEYPKEPQDGANNDGYYYSPCSGRADFELYRIPLDEMMYTPFPYPGKEGGEEGERGPYTPALFRAQCVQRTELSGLYLTMQGAFEPYCKSYYYYETPSGYVNIDSTWGGLYGNENLYPISGLPTYFGVESYEYQNAYPYSGTVAGLREASGFSGGRYNEMRFHAYSASCPSSYDWSFYYLYYGNGFYTSQIEMNPRDTLWCNSNPRYRSYEFVQLTSLQPCTYLGGTVTFSLACFEKGRHGRSNNTKEY